MRPLLSLICTFWTKNLTWDKCIISFSPHLHLKPKYASYLGVSSSLSLASTWPSSDFGDLDLSLFLVKLHQFCLKMSKGGFIIPGFTWILIWSVNLVTCFVWEILREAFKNPSHGKIPLRGRGVPPFSAKKKSVENWPKNSVFWAKKAVFSELLRGVVR